MHRTPPAPADALHRSSSPVASVCDRRTNKFRIRRFVTPRRRRLESRGGHKSTTRFQCSHLLSLPEGANVGQAVNEAMRSIPAAVAIQTCPNVVQRSRNLPRHSATTPGGRILDPACGSGGMFIQSARFVEAHQKNPTAEISVRGDQFRSHGGLKHSILTS